MNWIVLVLFLGKVNSYTGSIRRGIHYLLVFFKFNVIDTTELFFLKTFVLESVCVNILNFQIFLNKESYDTIFLAGFVKCSFYN